MHAHFLLDTNMVCAPVLLRHLSVPEPCIVQKLSDCMMALPVLEIDRNKNALAASCFLSYMPQNPIQCPTFMRTSQLTQWTCIARQRDTTAVISHVVYYLLSGFGTPQKGALSPLLLSFTQAYLCNPAFYSISHDTCAIPHKNNHERAS